MTGLGFLPPCGLIDGFLGLWEAPNPRSQGGSSCHFIQRSIFLGFILALTALALLACGGPGKTMSQEDYGDDWPLTVSEAKLFCEHDMVWVEAKGRAYPVNGTAMNALPKRRPDLAIRDIKNIWRYDVERNKEMLEKYGSHSSFRVDISPLMRDGFELCE